MIPFFFLPFFFSLLIWSRLIILFSFLRNIVANDWIFPTNSFRRCLGNRFGSIHFIYFRNNSIWLCSERRTTKKGENNSWNIIEMCYYYHFCCSKTISHAGHYLFIFCTCECYLSPFFPSFCHFIYISFYFIYTFFIIFLIFS